MKVSELEGALLDYWVAKADGAPGAVMLKGSLYHENGMGGYYRFNFRPSTNWLQGGPIIEREKIAIIPFNEGTEYGAIMRKDGHHFIEVEIDETDKGPTPLIAAMRCFVADKFGFNLSLCPDKE